MTEIEYRQLTHEELNALAGEELPERAAMSLINANVAAPINAAIALGRRAGPPLAALLVEEGRIAAERRTLTRLYADYARGVPDAFVSLEKRRLAREVLRHRTRWL